MFEHYRQPLLPRQAFYLHMVGSVVLSFVLLISTVLMGAIAFHFIEGFTWIDASLNCVLIMTGVGMASVVTSSVGKIFTGVYSCFSTLIFFTILAIIFTPLLPRLLYKFHLDLDRKG